MNDSLHNLFFVLSQKVLIAETRLNALSGDINEVLLIKELYKNKCLFDYATNNSLSTLSPISIFLLFFACTLKTGFMMS